MSALMTPRRAKRGRRTPRPAGASGQSALFGAGSAPAATAVATPVVEPTPAASAHRHGPTLDDLVAGAWEGLLAGAPASCVVCGTAMHPRYSGGHAPVGGRCTGCGTTLG